MDTANATGRLMLNVLGSVAAFERELLLERQKVGIAKAKAEGKYKGKKRTISLERARALRDGGMTLQQIADDVGVTRQAVHKLLKEAARGTA